MLSGGVWVGGAMAGGRTGLHDGSSGGTHGDGGPNVHGLGCSDDLDAVGNGET